MSWVVDASVAAKWFFNEELTDQARELLGSEAELLAPDLVLSEVCNVGWKRMMRNEVSAEQARAIAKALPEMFSLLVPSVELIELAMDLAIALSHPAYDCFYIALAQGRGIPLVTADRRLLGHLDKGKWDGSAVFLGDLPSLAR